MNDEVGYLAAKSACSGVVMQYEFKVVPAPRRGEKARGVKTTEERFALALTLLMNDLGREGWDYVRADTLPVDERSGLTGTKTSYHNMLVFRRQVQTSAGEPAPQRLIAVESFAAPRLGAANPGVEGTAPTLGPANSGPANSGIAAE